MALFTTHVHCSKKNIFLKTPTFTHLKVQKNTLVTVHNYSLLYCHIQHNSLKDLKTCKNVKLSATQRKSQQTSYNMTNIVYVR